MKKLNKESEENRCVGAIINRQNGITLISLVITIVVLIILAGVAISMTLGENGIFTKAQEAKKAQAIATAKEQIGLELLEAQIEAIDNNEELEQEQVEEIVAKYGVLQADGDTIVLNDSGYEVSLSDIYNTMANTETDGDTTIELAQLKALLSQTTVTEDKILKDYKAYKDGQLITGTMENYAGQTQDATATSDDTYTYLNIPNNGYYTTDSKLRMENSNLSSKGISYGSVIANVDGSISISCEFKPKIIQLYCSSDNYFGFWYNEDIDSRFAFASVQPSGNGSAGAFQNFTASNFYANGIINIPSVSSSVAGAKVYYLLIEDIEKITE